MTIWLKSTALAVSLGAAFLILLEQAPADVGRIDQLIPNAEFVPNSRSHPAATPFVGTVVIEESRMRTQPAVLNPARIMGREPQLFPGVSLSFFTHDGDLVPTNQDVIRIGSENSGHSFWDLIVQPGRVWSEAGEGDWSRAAFPFALVNSIEGETHNGLVSFRYRRGEVSAVRFQIVQQTAPFYVKDLFTAWGSLTARWAPPQGAQAQVSSIESQNRTYETSLAHPVRMAEWHDLAAQVGAASLAGYDGTMRQQDIVLAGLDYRGTFYWEQCPSAAGPLPWCDRARFGVWSATKALANETALLHLAQEYGPEVFSLKIADYAPQAAAYPAWRNVTFENAIDMATGIGNGSAKIDPNDISDGYLDPTYKTWYEARSAKDKMSALLSDGRVYPWGPGKVARYRDQDMFILGVAMSGYLKSKRGPSADLWDMLCREVFAPIGIVYAPVNRTIEPDGARGQPMMAYGYYPTVPDLVRIARLYQNGGAADGRQLLYAPRIAQLAAHIVQPGAPAPGLVTGEHLSSGETWYRNAFWIAPYRSSRGCRIIYPRMIGWGGNIVALLPGAVTGIRLAKSAGEADNADIDTGGMAHTADALTDLCRGTGDAAAMHNVGDNIPARQ